MRISRRNRFKLKFNFLKPHGFGNLPQLLFCLPVPGRIPVAKMNRASHYNLSNLGAEFPFGQILQMPDKSRQNFFKLQIPSVNFGKTAHQRRSQNTLHRTHKTSPLGINISLYRRHSETRRQLLSGRIKYRCRHGNFTFRTFNQPRFLPRAHRSDRRIAGSEINSAGNFHIRLF